MTDLSTLFPAQTAADFYKPASQHFDGISDYMHLTSGGTTGKLRTGVLRFKFPAFAGDQLPGKIINGGGGTDQYQFAWWLFSDGLTYDTHLQGRLTFQLGVSGGALLYYACTKIAVTDDEWHSLHCGYDGDNGTGFLNLDGVDSDDLTWANRVAPITGQPNVGSGAWSISRPWWTASGYRFEGDIGFLGIGCVYEDAYSNFFDSNNNPIKQNESTWAEWGGVQPVIFNEHASLVDNKGSFGNFVYTGGIGNTPL